MPIDMIAGFNIHARGSRWFAHIHGYGFALTHHNGALVCASHL